MFAVFPTSGTETFRRFQFQGSFEVPFGEIFDNKAFGGISGLAHIKDDYYFALSDDRGYIQSPRFFKIKAHFARREVKIVNATLFLKDGKPLPKLAIDPEGIAILPWGNLLISTEADLKSKIQSPLRIIEFKQDGNYVRDISVPNELTASPQKGPRNNLGFEGLCISPSGKTVIAAMESSLYQDGEPATFEQGSQNRILEFKVDKPTRSVEFLKFHTYLTEPVPKPNSKAESRGNGISEVACVDDRLIFVLERATFFQEDSGFGNQVRIFEFDLVTRKKTLVFDSNSIVTSLPKGRIDNIEAMALGPDIQSKEVRGLKSMILAADNNFNPLQRNIFLFFSVFPRGLPATKAEK